MGSEPLTGADRAWLRMEEPTNLMMITGLLGFRRLPTVAELARLIEERLLVHARFRQRVVTGPLGARWEDDPSFDPLAHLHRVGLPPPGGQAALEELVGDLMSTPLDLGRPLWQVHLVDAGDGSGVLLIRLHHCIADGFALMRVVLSLTDEPEGARTHATAARGGGLPALGRALRDPAAALAWGRHLADGAIDTGRLLLLPPDPPSPFKGPLGVRKNAAWTPMLPLAPLKAAGRAAGATLNDVILAATAGALRRYLDGRGVHLERALRAVVPVNLRPADAPLTLGNRFGLVFLPLPVQLDQPRARLAEVARQMGELKRSPEAAVTLAILDTVGRTAAVLEDLAVGLFATKATLVCTNVPGPRDQLHLAGQAVDSFLFFVPQSGRVGLGVSLLSYRDHVRMAVASDRGLVPDPATLVRHFEEELALLQAGS